MTYAELVQKIRDYTEVDSNVLTSTIVDGIISDKPGLLYSIFKDKPITDSKAVSEDPQLMVTGSKI